MPWMGINHLRKEDNGCEKFSPKILLLLWRFFFKIRGVGHVEGDLWFA